MECCVPRAHSRQLLSKTQVADNTTCRQPFARLSLNSASSSYPAILMRNCRNRDRMRRIDSSSLMCSSTHSLTMGKMLCKIVANPVTRWNTLSRSCKWIRTWDLTSPSSAYHGGIRGRGGSLNGGGDGGGDGGGWEVITMSEFPVGLTGMRW